VEVIIRETEPIFLVMLEAVNEKYLQEEESNRNQRPKEEKQY
jgi:hypothetical protein